MAHPTQAMFIDLYNSSQEEHEEEHKVPVKGNGKGNGNGNGNGKGIVIATNQIGGISR